MLWSRVPAWMLGALIALLAAAFRLGADWDARLVALPVHGQWLAAQSSDEGDGLASGGSPRTYQRVSKGGLCVSEYGFENFNRDRLRLSYKIPAAIWRRYDAAYGYRPEQIKELQARHQSRREGALQFARKTGKSQAQLDNAVAVIDKQYQDELGKYLSDKGFKLEPGNVTRIDVPLVVRSNAPLLKPVAGVIERVAGERRYGTLDVVGAGLSFVQTALRYQDPPDVDPDGRHTAGFRPPVTTIVNGWGDCDTKTALLASILANWGQMRMVGLFLPGHPGHYLMGVLLIPDQGDAFVEYQGLKYVLVEPAGPAWLPPGRVGDGTLAKFSSPDGYKIDPFF